MDSSQKLTNTDVKKLNKNRIFRLIYNSDKISRQEIADRLGLSLPTVNQNLKMLMEDGLISFHYSTPSINLATKLNAAPSPDFLPPPSDILK
jgi:predicted ArsR family transcriptional regulator